MHRNKIFCFAVALTAVCAFGGEFAYANNVSVSNVKLVSLSTSAGTIAIQFDLSWNNAWKDSVNNDAVWVFFKYSSDAGTSWGHATMKTAGTNPSGVSTGTKASGAFNSLDVIVTNDKKGAFIQPRSLSSGTVSFTSLQLIWDYKQDGFSDAAMLDATNTKIRAFAIEMVYIPTGGFFAGAYTSDMSFTFLDSELNETADGSGINSEDQIIDFSSVDCVVGTWCLANYLHTGETAYGSLPGAYPKGVQAFYLMKYEITQGQYVGFFNTLTSPQKANRDITSATGKNSDSVVNRNTIAWTSGDATTTRSDRACNYLSAMDVMAYADWAALRPMTELEYGKASTMGSTESNDGGYSWGSTFITAGTTISGSENGTEVISTSGANCNYNQTSFSGGDTGTGPLRAGIFATSITITPASSGAGYYGNLDLTGNVWESVVALGNSNAHRFTGSHGDGILTQTSGFEGNATNPDWPGIDSTPANGVTGALGAGHKGGGWNTTDASYLAVWNRAEACDGDASRGVDFGGRCARTASS